MAHAREHVSDDLARRCYRLVEELANDRGDRWEGERARLLLARRRQLLASLYENERDWRFSPGDGGDAAEPSDLALARAVLIEEIVRERRQASRVTPAAAGADADDERLDALRRRIKHFPVLFISAPHVEPGTTGTFPGIPTPLLYATAVLDRSLRIDEFPCFRVPEVVAVMNPLVYDEPFRQALDRCLIERRPRVVGISNLSEGHHFALRIARRVKALVPDAIVILGGSHEDGTNPRVYQRAAARARAPHPTARGVPRVSPGLASLTEAHIDRIAPLQTLAADDERDAIDFVAAGDCPYLLFELLQIVADNVGLSPEGIKHIVAGSADRFAQVEGSGDLFFSRAGSPHIEHVSLSGRPLDRNALPFIYLGHLTQENRFPVFHGKKTAQVMSCVGCKYSCAFCYESIDQILYEVPKLQPRSAENVIKELDLLAEQGYDAVFFDDSTFTQQLSGVCRLLDLMIERIRQHGRYFEWGCQTTINDVEPSLIARMAEAGCTYIYFGLESAEPGPDAVHKAKQLRLVTAERWADRFRDVADWCHGAGIRVGTSVQFGLNDSPEQQRQTLDLLAELYRAGRIAPHSIALNINTPYPGTEEWVSVITEPDRALPDYRERLRRHPGFETAHQFAALPHEAAERLYAMAVERLGDAIVGVDTAFSSSAAASCP